MATVTALVAQITGDATSYIQAIAAAQAATAKGAAAIQASGERMLRSFSEELVTFGMNSRAAQIKLAQLAGVSNTVLKEAVAAHTALRAREVAASVETPEERRAKAVRELDLLLGKGAITQETYNRAVSQMGSTAMETAASVAYYAQQVLIAVKAVAGIEDFALFNKKMTESTSIMGDLTKEQTQGMEKLALNMSTKWAKAPHVMAEAYYFLASSGFEAEEAMRALEPVTKFAVAGAFDTTTAVTLATDALHALGLKAETTTGTIENLTRVMNVLVAADAEANATVRQFSEALTRDYAASLRLYHKEVEEGVAILMAYASQGIKGRHAGSTASRLLRMLAREANENAEAHKRLGVAVYDTATGAMRPMVAILKDFERVTAGASDQQRSFILSQLGYDVKIQQALLPLINLSGQIEENEKKLRDMGVTIDSVSGKQMKAFANQMTNIHNRVKALSIEVGGNLAPAVLALGKAFEECIIFLSQMPNWLKQTLTYVTITTVFISASAIAVYSLSAAYKFLIGLPLIIWLKSMVVWLGAKVVALAASTKAAWLHIRAMGVLTTATTAVVFWVQSAVIWLGAKAISLAAVAASTWLYITSTVAARGALGAMVFWIKSTVVWLATKRIALIATTGSIWANVAATAASSAAMAGAIGIGVALGVAIAHTHTAYERLNQEMERSAKLNKQNEEIRAGAQKTRMDKAAEIKDPMERKKFLEDEIKRLEKNREGQVAGVNNLKKQAEEMAPTAWSLGQWGKKEHEVTLNQLKEQQAQLDQTREHIKALKEEAGKIKIVEGVGIDTEALESLTKLVKKLRDETGRWRTDSDEFELNKLKGKGVGKVAGAELEEAERLLKIRKEQKTLDEVQSHADRLKEQADTWRMAADEAEIYKLKVKGATEAQLDQVRALNAQIEQQKQLDKEYDKFKKRVDEAQKIIDEAKTPEDKFLEKVTDLNKMLNEGLIGFNDYTAAIAKARAELEKVNKETEKLTAIQGAAYRSAEALARANQYRETNLTRTVADENRTRLNQSLDAAVQQVVQLDKTRDKKPEQELQNKLLQDIKDILLKQGKNNAVIAPAGVGG